MQALLGEWAAGTALADAAAAAAEEEGAAAAARRLWCSGASDGGSGGGGGKAESATAALPDLLSGSAGGGADAGASRMAWRPTRGFGRAGCTVGRHWYWTACPAGALRDVHYRRPVAAAGGADGADADGSGSGGGGTEGGGGAAGTELVLDENAAAAAAGADGGYRLASLDVSPCGRLLAVTEERGGPGAPPSLRVLRLGAGGGSVVCEAGAVAGPVVWACPQGYTAGSSSEPDSSAAPPSVGLRQQQQGAQAAAAAGGGAAQGGGAAEGEAHLMFLAASEMEVRALSFSPAGELVSGGGDDADGPGGSGKGAAISGAVVYRDPYGIRARLWRAPIDTTPGSSGGGAARRSWAVMVAGLAPDDAPLEVRCLPPGAHPLAGLPRRLSGSGGGDGKAAQATGCGWIEVASVDPLARVAVSTWGAWLFLRWASVWVGQEATSGLMCRFQPSARPCRPAHPPLARASHDSQSTGAGQSPTPAAI
jgi:hypothetical protein